MLYITGEHALNLRCALDTCGDWHSSSLSWNLGDISFADSSQSIFGDWGITVGSPVRVPDQANRRFNIADHLRALLDMLAAGRFPWIVGMREEFICNEEYTPVLFEQVSKLRGSEKWDAIDQFMAKEYGRDWLYYRNEAVL